MLNKRLGQHFLRDKSVLDALTAAIAPTAGQTILEIGAGDGALTNRLQHAGAQIVALEVDRRFADRLSARYQPQPNVSIIHADALTADWRSLTDSGSRLAGNLPYNISTALLLKIAAHSDWFTDCHVMLQKEVAQRICAAPASSDYGRLSVSLQLAFRIEWLFAVPPDAFTPPPAVESAVVRLLPLPLPLQPTPPAFERVLAAAFAQRRKTLKNALAALPMDWTQCAIGGERRAQTLSGGEFIELARHCRGDSAPENTADRG